MVIMMLRLSRKLWFSHLFLMIAFSLLFNSYLAAQYTLYHTGAPNQYQFDSLPQLRRIQIKTNVYPIPEYTYYNSTYQKNKVASVIATSKNNDTVYRQKYDREGYLIEETDHRLPPPELPDNRGHHYYSYYNEHRLVFDSLIPDNSKLVVKHQYLFDTAFRILSHRIISDDYLLPDSTSYTYDSIGNCIRIISFYKNYRNDRSGAVHIIKDGEANSMRSDTVQIQYQYTYDLMSSLLRKDNSRSDIYGTTAISIGGRRVGGEEQTFDALSRIIEIQSRGLTVQYYYQKNIIRMDMIYGVNEYGDASDERAIGEYTFYYDKHGHLKKVSYFTIYTNPPASAPPKVYSEKIRYRKNGLLINNPYGGKMIYDYYH
jgi:hypothetical protein